MSEVHKAVTRADEAGKLLHQAREDWFVLVRTTALIER